MLDAETRAAVRAMDPTVRWTRRIALGSVIGLIVLTGIAGGSSIAFQAALLLAMVGFVGTAAYAKFCLRGDIIE